MQDYFEFSNNVKIFAGEKSLEKLPSVLMNYGGYRIFIVSDTVIKKFGHLDAVTKVIKAQEAMTIGGIYLDVPSLFTTTDLDKLYVAFRKSGADAIVGIGGTRVMNAAKALALLVSTKSKNITKFRGIDAAVRVAHVAFCLIPTTFGAGNEVSKSAIVLDDEKQIPIEVISGALQPHFAILDPSLLKTLPEREIYMSLIDLMAFSIDSYLSKRSNLLTKSFSKMAMFLIKDNFQKAIMDKDVESICNLQIAASIAAISYSNTYTGVAHSIATALAAKYHIHRGEAICVVIEPVLESLKEICKAQYAEMLLYYRGTQDYANSTEDERSETFIRIIKNLVTRLSKEYDVKTNLSGYGVKEEDLDAIAEMVINDGDMLTSPKKYTKEDIIEILRQSL